MVELESGQSACRPADASEQRLTAEPMGHEWFGERPQRCWKLSIFLIVVVEDERSISIFIELQPSL